MKNLICDNCSENNNNNKKMKINEDKGIFCENCIMLAKHNRFLIEEVE